MIVFIIFFGLLVVLILLGIAIPFAIGGTSLIAMILESGITKMSFGVIAQKMTGGVNSFTLLAIPFFLFAGKLMNKSSITKRIATFANYIVGWIPGGLAHSNIVSSLLQAGMCGSAVADAAGLGAVQLYAMKNAGFKTDFAAACTASSAIIAPITPPSIPLVVFGVAGSVSINRLFMGGIIPGVLVCISLMTMVFILAQRRNYPRTAFPGWKIFFKAGADAFLPFITPVILIGGIIAGIFTATEAAVVASLYAFILTFFVYREVKIRDIISVCMEVVRESAAIMIIVSVSALYGFLLIKTQMPNVVMKTMLTLTQNKYLVLFLLNIFLLVFGLCMETNSAIIILTPLILPITTALGIDPVHFGLVMIMNLMIGLLTPPVGMLLFVVCRVAKLPLDVMLKAIIPFYVPLLLILFLVTYLPQIVLWLPNLIFG